MAFVGGASAAFTGLTNGSFETGFYTDNGSGFQQLDAPNTNLDGWSVDAGSVDWISTYWPAGDGAMSIDMSGGDAGTLSQTFDTTIGNTYTVAFLMSGNPAGPPSVKTLEVSATGGTTGLYVHDTTGTDLTTMVWTPQTYTFLATSASTTLTFTSTTAGAFGPAIDAVAVTEDAAEKDDCKNGGWESMLDTSGNSFKNQGDCVSFFATKGKNLGAVPAAVAPTADSSSDKQATKRAENAAAKSDRQTEKAGSTKAKSKGKSAEHRGSNSKSKKPKK
jgi:choice-of-anchor C domain-containing protein